MARTSTESRWTDQSSRNDERDLFAIQVELLYGQSHGALTGSLLSSVVVAALFWGHTTRAVLVSWFLALLFAGALRIWLLHAYRHAADTGANSARWEGWLVAGLAMTGAVWGLGALVLPPPGFDAYAAFYLLWAGGLCAGAVVAYSIRIRAVMAFVLPALGPYAAYSLARGDAEGRTLAAMLALYFAFLLFSAWRARDGLLNGLRLQLEIRQEVGQVNAERERTERVNAELRSDIDKHQRTLETLQHAKQRAEDLAQRLQLLSSLDGLTGIANRRHFDEGLDREWRRALRSRTTISLIMVDIDFFKPYNDTYGHQAGDECLKQVARLLKGYSRRAGDFAARYGGEEFAVVLSGTDGEGAREIAEEIRLGVESLGIPRESSRVKAVVTVSAGVAALTPVSGATPDVLVRMADSALYQAKDAGRNRVAMADSKTYPRASAGS
jgi:diguanylate cyclase (GGDEF)-like protein